MKNKKTTMYLVQGAVIAALYVAMTYTQEALLPSSTSMAVQFRASELLTMLALFTPAAVPGLTVGCLLANLMNAGALPVDMIFGSLATFMATLAMRKCRGIRFKKLPLLSASMPAIFNGVIIGWEIETFFIEGSFKAISFFAQAGLVALGEVGVLFLLGIPFAMLIENRKLDKKLFKIN